MATLRTLPSGKIQAQVRLSGTKPRSKSFQTEAEAKLWASSLEVKLTEDNADEISISLICIGNILLSKLKPQTSKVYKYRLNPLVHFFGDKRLDTFHHSDLEHYANSRSVKPATIRSELEFLSRCIKHCRAIGKVPSTYNPFQDYRLPPSSESNERVLTKDEYSRIVNDISPELAPLVQLAWNTAMRRSELLSIKRRNIRWDERLLLLSNTKNGKPREVPLNKAALKVLKRRCQQTTAEQLWRIKPNSITQGFRRCCDRLGIQDAVFHSLRHTAATRYAKAGLSMAQLKVVTGHTDYRSLVRYTHLKASDVVNLLD